MLLAHSSVVRDLELGAILQMPRRSRTKPAKNVWTQDLLQIRWTKDSVKWNDNEE